MKPAPLNLALFGANRGANHVVDAMLKWPHPLPLRGGRTDIVDPKPNRAHQLAMRLRPAGVISESWQGTAQQALEVIDPATPAVVAVDNMETMAHVHRHSPKRRVYTQAVGQAPSRRGLSGVTFGLSIPAVPGREEAHQQGQLLFDALAGLSPAVSSNALRSTGRNQLGLAHARTHTSKFTVDRLLQRERTEDDDVLAHLLLGEQHYPLVIYAGEGETDLQRREEALDLTLPTRPTAVALVQPDRRVDFFVVRPSANGGRILRWMPFGGEPAPAVERLRPGFQQQVRASQPLRFTD